MAPLALAETTTALTHTLAGVAKVAGPNGWSWADGRVLADQVAVDGVRKKVLGKGAPAGREAAGALTRRLPRAGTRLVAARAGCAVGPARPSARPALGCRRLGPHVGILLVMRITFRYQLSGIVFSPSVPLERAVEPLLDVLERAAAVRP